MSDNIEVSVVMPVWNTPFYAIREAVGSFHEQLGQVRRELIIVDDGSTEQRTLDAIEEARVGPGVRVIKLDGNQGAGVARNAGLLDAHGTWVAFLDSDDSLTPTALMQRLYLAESSSLDFVWTSFVYRAMHHSWFGERDGWRTFELSSSPPIKDLHCHNCRQPMDHATALDTIKDHNHIATITTLVRRRLALSVGGFEEGLVCGEDHLFWRRIFQATTRTGFIDHPTAYYQSWMHKPHQSKSLHMPSCGGGFHLDTGHAMGKAGEYLDERASARAAEWKDLGL